MIRRIAIALVLLVATLGAAAQQYTGMSGLIHVPDADMDSAGDARIGMHYLDRHMLPDRSFVFQGKPYNTIDAYLSITPFSWVEVGFTMTFFRKLMYNGHESHWKNDRYFSVKFQPLREKKGKWWPSIAVGSNDFVSSGLTVHTNPESGNNYFRNFYVAATKHFEPRGHDIGVTLAYRYYTQNYARKWNGVVGAVTYRPRFFRPLRGILEYAGGGQVNFGVDCLLWKHLLIQASLQRFKYFSGGVCYVVNLF